VKIILEYIKKVKLYVLLYFACKLVNRVSTLAIALLTKEIVDSISLTESVKSLNHNGILLAMAIIIFVASMAAEYYFKSLGEFRVEMLLKNEIMESLITKKYTSEESIGAVIQRFTTDINKCKTLLVTAFVDILVDVVYVLAIVLLMIRMNLILSSVLLVIFGVVFVINKYYLPHISQLMNDLYETEEEYTSQVEFAYNGEIGIKSFNAHSYIIKRVDLIVARLVKTKKRIVVIESLVDYFGITGLMNLVPVVIYWFGGQMVFKQVLTVGDLVAFSLLFSKMWTPIERLLDAPKKIKLNKLSLNRVREITSYEKMTVGNQLLSFDQLKIESLQKAYDEKVIFDDFELEINKGDKLWLKGTNGKGKSTLLKIMTQLENYQSGRITINGQDLSELDEISIREKKLYVPQEAYVFSKFTDENIYLDFDRKVTFDSHIQKKTESDSFSMGERKVMQIMRSINLDADFYIFDEPLAYVDEESKAVILDLIKTKLSSKTLVIVSHEDIVMDDLQSVYI